MAQVIIDHIRVQANKEIEGLLRRANRVRDRDIEKAKNKLQEWINLQNKKMVKEKICVISQKRASAMRQFRLERESVYERIWKDFRTSLMSVLSEAYRDEHYMKLIFSIVSRINSHYGIERIKLLFNESDKLFFSENWENMRNIFSSVFTNCMVDLGETVAISGGVIVEEIESGRRFDFSFDALVNALEYELKNWLVNSIKVEN